MSGNSTPDKRLSWSSPDGKTLAIRRLRVADLDSVYALSGEQLNAAMAPIETARRVLEQNADTIWGVFEGVSPEEKLVGFLSFLMLNQEGAALLKRDAFDALDPDPRYLVDTGTKPAAVYVWLIVARGLAAVAVPLTTQAMGKLYADVPLYGRAATEAGAKGFRAFGYTPAHQDRPDLGNLFVLNRSPSPTEVAARPNDADIRIKIAHSSVEVEHARAVRAAVFIAEQNCPYAEEFDGNDHTATHVVAYVDGEPAATLRLRYFGTFVKIERLAVIRRFRGQSVADEIAKFAIDFLARKGFRTGYGHPQLRILPFWERHGFHLIKDIERFSFSDHEYLAVDGDLPARDDAITVYSDPMLIVRPEGEWDTPGVLDRSAARPATNPHMEGA